MRSAVLVLALAFGVAAGPTYPLLDLKEYKATNENVDPSFEFKVGKTKFTANVNLNSEITYVFGKQCEKEKTCTKEAHKTNLDIGTDTSSKEFTVSYGEKKALKGYFFEKDFAVGDLAFKKNIGVVYEGNEDIPFPRDGQLGLGFGKNEDNSVVQSLFKEADKNKVIVYRQAGFNFPEVKKGEVKKEKKIYTVYSFGKIPSECKEIEYYPILQNKDKVNVWQIEADITIGDFKDTKKTVGFDLRWVTEVPTDVYMKHFYNKKDDEYKDFKISFGNKTFDIPVKNYLLKGTDKEDKKISQPIFGISSGDYDYSLGVDFLQHKCLVLKDDGGKYQIGIGKSASQISSVLFLSAFFVALLKWF